MGSGVVWGFGSWGLDRDDVGVMEEPIHGGAREQRSVPRKRSRRASSTSGSQLPTSRPKTTSARRRRRFTGWTRSDSGGRTLVDSSSA